MLKNLALSGYNLASLFHGFSAFTAKYPTSLKENLIDLFNANYKENPLACFAMFANSLTRKALIDDEFFRDHEMTLSIVRMNDIRKNNIAVTPIYSYFNVDYLVPQWIYTDNGDTNKMILMVNTLLETVQFNLSAVLGNNLKEAVVEANNFEGKIIEPEGKFMILTVIDESHSHYHAEISDADGENLYEDFAAYHAFPLLNGIKAFNFGAKPVKILYMPAV